MIILTGTIVTLKVLIGKKFPITFQAKWLLFGTNDHFWEASENYDKSSKTSRRAAMPVFWKRLLHPFSHFPILPFVPAVPLFLPVIPLFLTIPNGFASLETVYIKRNSTSRFQPLYEFEVFDAWISPETYCPHTDQYVHHQPLALRGRHEVGSLLGAWGCHCLACPRDVQGLPKHKEVYSWITLWEFSYFHMKAEARSAALSSTRRPSCIPGSELSRSSTRRTRSTDRTTRLLIALLGLFLIAETPMVNIASKINSWRLSHSKCRELWASSPPSTGGSSTKSATTRWGTSWTCSPSSTAPPTSSSTASCPHSSGRPSARWWTGRGGPLRCWPTATCYLSSQQRCELKRQPNLLANTL